jgi:translation initiation factor 3 subunit M
VCAHLTFYFARLFVLQAQVDQQGLAAAKDAAMGAIRDPVTLFHQQRGLLTMPAIQALSQNTETQRLYGLLTIFQEEKLEDYHEFVKKNGLPDGLSAENCIRHLRILSLCSLATEHEEIPYTTVAQTLQLPSDKEVESWVIAAVSSGLLVAKMDQLEHKVMVERAVVRRFDMEQWKALQSRLNMWKQNVRGILEGLKQTQAAAPM